MSDFILTLQIMGKGMLGIFGVTLAIMVSMYILNMIPSNDENK